MDFEQLNDSSLKKSTKSPTKKLQEMTETLTNYTNQQENHLIDSISRTQLNYNSNNALITAFSIPLTTQTFNNSTKFISFINSIKFH